MVAFLLGTSFFSGCSFAPGSYPYAEKYKIDATEQEVIKAIDCFFKDNPSYELPSGSFLESSQRQKRNYWYKVYFYDNASNQILSIYVRGGVKDASITTIGLVSISDANVISAGELINHDIKGKHNREIKEGFEKSILNKIKSYL